jgi:hypothetical protein
MTNPKACTCHTHPPAKPQAVELAKMEAILADCRARKATAKVGTPMPLIACLADKAADLRKGNARLASAEIDRLKGEVATLTAAAYLASTARPRMTRAEFSKLPHCEQGKAIKKITLIS